MRFSGIMCQCGHSHGRHEFYTQTLHGCKDCPGCTYFRPAGRL